MGLDINVAWIFPASPTRNDRLNATQLQCKGPKGELMWPNLHLVAMARADTCSWASCGGIEWWEAVRWVPHGLGPHDIEERSWRARRLQKRLVFALLHLAILH